MALRNGARAAASVQTQHGTSEALYTRYTLRTTMDCNNKTLLLCLVHTTRPLESLGRHAIHTLSICGVFRLHYCSARKCSHVTIGRPTALLGLQTKFCIEKKEKCYRKCKAKECNGRDDAFIKTRTRSRLLSLALAVFTSLLPDWIFSTPDLRGDPT